MEIVKARKLKTLQTKAKLMGIKDLSLEGGEEEDDKKKEENKGDVFGKFLK
jgi:hypothetical protein